MLPARLLRFLPACGLLLCAASARAATPLQDPAASWQQAPPALHARAAVLMEARTGTILFEEHADVPIPPASLTKLMTLHIALDQIDAGLLDPAEEVVPGPDAWASSMPPGSSLMFLGPGQRLTIDQLLKGLVVDSGNDAAVALADRIAGSVPGFARLMNAEAAGFGYKTMHFVEPAGTSAANTVTAREFADFCRRFIDLHPDALKSLFSLKEFTYPLAENLTGGNHEKPITQSNRNVLLGRYEGADGLKTGYIDESGYHIAVTAQRGGMRLISVILGVPNVGRISGAELRATESAALLDYGFGNFVTVQPAYGEPAPVQVWKGKARSVVIGAGNQPVAVVRNDQARRVKTFVEQEREVEAPVHAGQVLGYVVVTVDEREIARFPLEASVSVARGGLLRRVVDSVRLSFRRVFRTGSP